MERKFNYNETFKERHSKINTKLLRKNNSGAKIKIVPHLNQELIPKKSTDSIPRSCFDRDLTYKNKTNQHKNTSKISKTNSFKSIKSYGNSVNNSIKNGSIANSNVSRN